MLGGVCGDVKASRWWVVPQFEILLNCRCFPSRNDGISGQRDAFVCDHECAPNQPHHWRAQLAAHKVTRYHKFPQTRGKIVADVEVSVSPDYYAVHIKFQDKTALTFDLESCVQLTPELADWKTGDYKLLKRWQPVRSRSSRT